jgi:hypothetical protein
MRTAIRRLLLASTLSVLSTPVLACGIVYGTDWAFVSVPPKGWDAACGDGSMEGTNITLRPHSQPESDPNGLIYVTVNDKNPPTLGAFAIDEQTRLKHSSPATHVSQMKVPNHTGKFTYILARVQNAPGGREEIVAYLDGPTAFYILVLSAKSASVLNDYKAAFLEYVDSFTPMAFSE